MLPAATRPGRGAPRPGARASGPATRTSCSSSVERALREAGASWDEVRADRRRHRPGQLHRACASASPPRARLAQALGTAARRRLDPGGAGPRCGRGRRAPSSPCSTPAAARRSPPRGRATSSLLCARRARARALAERVAALVPAPLAVGDGAIRFRRAWRRAGAEVPADGDSAHRVRRPDPLRARGLGAPAEARSPRCCPTTSAVPDAEIARRASPCEREPPRDPPPDLRRPPAGHRDRAPRVPDAVVAGDVRARAVQALGRLPRRARATGGSCGYLRVLALRHRLAPDEHRGRPDASSGTGVATALLAALCERDRRRAGALHARGAALQRRRRSRSTSATASAPPGCAAATTRTTARTPLIMWSTPATRGGLARRRARRRRAARTGDPRARDELRRHLRGRPHRRRRDPLERHLLAGDPRPLRRRGARGRLAPSPRADQRRGRRRARRAPTRPSTTSTLVAVTQGPGLVGALLVGLATAKALAAAARAAAGAGRPSPGPRRREPPGSPSPFEPPFLCLIASGGHTLLARVDDHGALRRARAHARRRRGRGDRQGRAAARTAVPGRPGARAPRRGRRPARVRVPDRCAACAGLDFSFAGLKTALLYTAARPGRGRGAGAARPTSRPPTSARSSRRSSQRAERALEADGARPPRARRRGRRQRPAARRAWAARRSRGPHPALDLCTDNAAMIASAARFVAPLPYPDYLGARRVRHRRLNARRGAA